MVLSSLDEQGNRTIVVQMIYIVRGGFMTKKESCFETLRLSKKEEGNAYIYTYNVDCVLSYAINMTWVNILVVASVRVLYAEV